MNVEQINAASGRELDALVAEHVFGWRWMELDALSRCFVGLLPSANSELMNPGKWRDVTNEPNKAPRARDWGREVPFYSADGNAMLAVLDKMVAAGWVHQLGGEVNHKPDAAFWHYGGVNLRGEAGNVWQSSGDTLPEAVCRAALLALCAKEGR